MTYCVGLLVDRGAVLLSDTRTNAGIDDISTYRKMFIFEEPGERVVVVMTAGSLSTTQTLIAHLQEKVDDPDAESVLTAPTMLGVAEMIGAEMARVRANIDSVTSASQSKPPPQTSASLIVCGQRKGGAMRLFLVYPEGNFIEATEDTPFLQIGETKYGKPILDRVIRKSTSMEDAKKAVLLSMDSTLRSNLSVGMPLDLAIVRDGECRVGERRRIEADDPTFAAMSQAWSEALRNAFTAIEI